MSTTGNPSLPALRRGVRLRHDAARDQWVLLAPERVIELDEIAKLIIERFDGLHSVTQIAAELASQFNAQPMEIEADITELVAQLHGKHLLIP